MKIFIWTDLALMDYHENIDFLLQEWSEKEAINFIEDVENVLFSLKNGNLEYKESNYYNLENVLLVSTLPFITDILVKKR